VIGRLLEASGAGAHFLDNPLQRIKRESTCWPAT
jgi:hypothetical protein